MVLQSPERGCFRSEQNGHCDQQVTDVPRNFAHVFANKVPALSARKSRVPLDRRRKCPFRNVLINRGATDTEHGRHFSEPDESLGIERRIETLGIIGFERNLSLDSPRLFFARQPTDIQAQTPNLPCGPFAFLHQFANRSSSGIQAKSIQHI
jgi:hypothetical protein